MILYSKIAQRVCWVVFFALLWVAPGSIPAHGQAPLGPGYPAWLAYRPVNPTLVFGSKSQIPDTIFVLGSDNLAQSSAHELSLGWRGMLNHVPRVLVGRRPELAGAAENIVVVGTQAQVRGWRSALAAGPSLVPDAYRLHRVGHILLVEGGDPRGVLYGAFALLRAIAQERSLRSIDVTSQPWAAIRRSLQGWRCQWRVKAARRRGERHLQCAQFPSGFPVAADEGPHSRC